MPDSPFASVSLRVSFLRTQLGAVLLVLALAAPSRAETSSLDACVSVCQQGPAMPECTRCEEYNVCSDLYHTDRAAYDACMARATTCHETSYFCGIGRAAAILGNCDKSYRSGPCCAAACEDQIHPPLSTSPLWGYLDIVAAPLVRSSGLATELQLAVGGHLELLFGASSRRDPDLGLRLGPFFTVTANIGSDVGVQLATGASVLVWGGASQGYGGGVLISGGIIDDLPPVGNDALGGLLRVSGGMTSIGDSWWKPVSIWLFVEGHYIPDDGPGGDRIEVMLGMRMGLASWVFIFIPSGGDPPH